MGSSRRPSRGKRINPHFWVFCEGKTEEAYVRFLRSVYRLPVEIITKVAGSSINENYIKNHKRGKFTHKKDKNFLIYDADVPGIIERLKKIKSAELIASNPAVEFWFLLHYKNQNTRITEEKCIKELSNQNRNSYKKGLIDDKLKEKLQGRFTEACSRAKQLRLFDNPSTNMDAFIEALENAKNETP